MKSKKTGFHGILLFLLMFFSVSAKADAGQWLQVEIIIFSHLNQQNLNSEYWPILTAPNFDARIATPGGDPSKMIRTVSPENWVLNADEKKLKNSGYVILKHIAWQQLIYGQAAGIPVHIHSDIAVPQVDGLLTIAWRQFFEVNLNLFFSEPMNKLQAISSNGYFQPMPQGLFYFQLHQKRRMRADELNYFTHPLYGVLLKIDRVRS